MERQAIVVLDVGKTMSKLSLWSALGELITRQVRPNERRAVGGVDVLDVEGIAPWVIDTLSHFSGLAEIAHIIPVAHGAAVAAVRNGALVHPPIDYEAAPPAAVREAYIAERSSFSMTGSPLLADGLNAGIQLFWMERRSPGVFDGATLLPWAQYWAWFLSSEAHSDVTSLGCHTDLWAPSADDFSPMAKRLGWADRFAPRSFAGDVVGRIRSELADQTGLPAEVEVHCGLHDSNAAVVAARAFPQIGGREATVLSTGTWFVAMRSPGESVDLAELPQARDCLVNVDAWGAPIPSARFMGGREIETLTGLDIRRVDIQPDQPALLAAVPELVQRSVMLTPTFAPGFGPFPEGCGHWIDEPEDWVSRRAAACLYAALVADVSLDLIGAKEAILVEGRFAEAQVFVRALASLRPGDRIYTCHADNDVSFGALRLINPELKPGSELRPVAPLEAGLSSYRRDWRQVAGRAAASD